MTVQYVKKPEPPPTNVVPATEFAKLREGDVFEFVSLSGKGGKELTSEHGRLLYAFPGKRAIIEDDWGGYRRQVGVELVPHRCGYVPFVDRFREWKGEQLRIEEVHIGSGAFLIRRISRGVWVNLRPDPSVKT